MGDCTILLGRNSAEVHGTDFMNGKYCKKDYECMKHTVDTVELCYIECSKETEIG